MKTLNFESKTTGTLSRGMGWRCRPSTIINLIRQWGAAGALLYRGCGRHAGWTAKCPRHRIRPHGQDGARPSRMARFYERHIRLNLLLLVFFSAVALGAQETAPTSNASPEAEATVKTRPESSDTASQQLIRNYLTVVGGAESYDRITNVVARGTLEEAGNIKTFELIELQDGKRHLRLKWRHLGRQYEERFAFDGLQAWRQELSPERKNAVAYSGQDAIHFSRQRWLLQPFVLPSVADYVFKYQGPGKVGGRPCHVIVGYGKKDVRSWFYFDQEKFLLLRWGGFGEIAGTREHMDYRANKFNRVDGVLFPSEIDLLAESAAYGSVQFDEILTNQQVDRDLFNKPQSRTPVLRQRPTPAN